MRTVVAYCGKSLVQTLLSLTFGYNRGMWSNSYYTAASGRWGDFLLCSDVKLAARVAFIT